MQLPERLMLTSIKILTLNNIITFENRFKKCYEKL